MCHIGAKNAPRVCHIYLMFNPKHEKCACLWCGCVCDGLAPFTIYTKISICYFRMSFETVRLCIVNMWNKQTNEEQKKIQNTTKLNEIVNRLWMKWKSSYQFYVRNFYFPPPTFPPIPSLHVPDSNHHSYERLEVLCKHCIHECMLQQHLHCHPCKSSGNLCEAHESSLEQITGK